MGGRSSLVRILALLGTVAVWSPIALMLVTGAMGTSRAGFLRVDYLIPAELFPLVIVSGGLLFYAAQRTRVRRPLIQGAFAVAVLALVLSQILVVVAGFASGARPAEGPLWVVAVALLVLYDLAVVAIGIGGVLLLRNLAR